MTTEIKSIRVLQAGIVSGILYAFLGVIVVPLWMLSNAAKTAPAAGAVTTALLLILIYPILGFVSGIVVAWFYNLTAGLVGGFRLELTQTN